MKIKRRYCDKHTGNHGIENLPLSTFNKMVEAVAQPYMNMPVTDQVRNEFQEALEDFTQALNLMNFPVRNGIHLIIGFEPVEFDAVFHMWRIELITLNTEDDDFFSDF